MGNKIGKISPKTGKITEYNVPTPSGSPSYITVGRDGSLWFIETDLIAHDNFYEVLNSGIYKFSPKDDKVTPYNVGN